MPVGLKQFLDAADSVKCASPREVMEDSLTNLIRMCRFVGDSRAEAQKRATALCPWSTFRRHIMRELRLTYGTSKKKRKARR